MDQDQNQLEQNTCQECERLKDDLQYTAWQLARSKAILASIGEGMLVLDEQGKVTFFNEQAQKMMNWTIGEVIGKKLIEIWKLVDEKKEVYPWPEDPVNKVISTKKSVKESYNLMLSNEEIIIVEVTFAPIELNGKNIGTVVVFRDITSEVELQRFKDDFIAVASHELKTPLTGLRWESQKLLRKESEGLTERQLELASSIYGIAVHLVDMIEDLLNISRMESRQVEVEKVDIAKIVSRIIDELSPVAEEKQVKVEMYDDHVGELELDSELLRHVFTNLLSNAIKYSHNGSAVHIRLKKDGDKFICEVQDWGIGISDQSKKLIFNRFFRATNAIDSGVPGTGLGLNLIKMIVEKCGGEIGFDSHESEGSLFWFWVPIGRRVDDSGN